MMDMCVYHERMAGGGVEVEEIRIKPTRTGKEKSKTASSSGLDCYVAGGGGG